MKDRMDSLRKNEEAALAQKAEESFSAAERVKEWDAETLKDCEDAIDKFGLIQAFNEVNEELLSGKGKIALFSNINDGDSWSDDRYGYRTKTHYHNAHAGVQLKWKKKKQTQTSS